LKIGIEAAIKHQHHGIGKAEIEELFGHLELLAAGLFAAGVLILFSGLRIDKQISRESITTTDSAAIGIIQGICLPFRGFSRSGSTISVGLLRGVAKVRLEAFSFALAVVLTPVVVLMEGKRLIAHHEHVRPVFVQSLFGMVFSFVAGLIALALLSKLLERGRWWIFGVYCLVASGAVLWMYHAGY
jgi:undecaprenyl-diphosphatase